MYIEQLPQTEQIILAGDHTARGLKLRHLKSAPMSIKQPQGRNDIGARL